MLKKILLLTGITAIFSGCTINEAYVVPYEQYPTYYTYRNPNVYYKPYTRYYYVYPRVVSPGYYHHDRYKGESCHPNNRRSTKPNVPPRSRVRHR